MCGRFTLTQTSEAIANHFRLSEVPDLPPRYNIAPTQPVAAIVLNQEQRQLRHFYWGLIPSWAKDPKIGARMVNARSETVSEKPAFRTAFKRRRCLIVTDGFYEWKKVGKQKQPFYFCRSDYPAGGTTSHRHPFAFAGLWEHWQSSEGDTIDSCTILTTEASDLMESIHNRMPVILDEPDYDCWLSPTSKPDLLQALLRPHSAQGMERYPVSSQVNRSANDSPDCIQLAEPLSISETQV
ncbi:MAG: SOS response-associated peptidase [Leptolyngbyaceae cyanobacterium SM1_4_3]|nr:SOS response-associated peptidase [Leptolyngbyaceae cyanobacterium SM1_4_3]NJN89851.1 SOS response-associated peptidase [Leptolyngbyaceae cyanobacterium SL_5_14]